MPKSVFALPYLGWLKFAIRWGVGEDRGSLGMASFMIRSVEAQVLASSSFPMVTFNHKPKQLSYLYANQHLYFFQAQAQAVAGPGFGAFADASLCRIEGSVGNLVGVHFDPNVNTGIGRGMETWKLIC